MSAFEIFDDSFGDGRNTVNLFDFPGLKLPVEVALFIIKLFFQW